MLTITSPSTTAASSTINTSPWVCSTLRCAVFDRKPRLARATRPDQRDQSPLTEQRPIFVELSGPPDERCGRGPHVRTLPRAQQARARQPAPAAKDPGRGSRSRAVADRDQDRGRARRRAPHVRLGRRGAPQPADRRGRAQASIARSRSRTGYSVTSASSSPTTAECRPSARPTSTRSSSAARRISLRRAM